MSYIATLFEDKTFLELLDENNSEKMVEYLNNNVEHWALRIVSEMFNSLGIFQDIAIENADPKKKYKYVLYKGFGPLTRGTIDLRNTAVYYNGVSEPVDSEVIIDETTTIKKKNSIWIALQYKEQKFKLTFLGVPKIVERGICLYPKILSQIEIKAKADIKDDIINLFYNHYIYTDKPSLRNKIKEI